MGNTLLLLLPAVFAAATFTLAAVLLVVTRRRRADTSATVPPITQLQALDTLLPDGSMPAGAATGGESTEEPVEVRSLRAHVRTLEQALEQEQERVLLERQDTSAAEELMAYRRRVDATIRAIGRQAEGDEAERILARVAAAVERLTAPDGFARPRLSPVGPVGVAPQVTPRTAPETAAGTAAGIAQQHVPTPAVDETSELVASTIEAEPVAAPIEPEVVLPVPLMAQSDEGRRGRRRFRTRAA